jgi:hypothetical protein
MEFDVPEGYLWGGDLNIPCDAATFHVEVLYTNSSMSRKERYPLTPTEVI